MNNAQRKRLTAMIDTLEQFKSDIEEILGDEQDALEEKSEKFKASEKGEMAAQIISYLEDAHSGMESAIDGVTNAAAPD